jgi:predicted RNase H-like nuclease
MPHDADAVLGIDAAWTDREPSGMALVQRRGTGWTCLRVAPSWESFCSASVDWYGSGAVCGSPVDAGAVLEACRDLLGGREPVVVAVDMPLAVDASDAPACVTGRREADNEVSRRFGRCKCAVHSPSPRRPGVTGRRLHEGFAVRGYSLATSRDCRIPALIEVYPHVALLGLTGRRARLPYKVGKTTTYWPGKTPEERKRLLRREWASILTHLKCRVSHVELPLPGCPEGCTFSYLKRFEDALDGLVCAWVATLYLQKDAACPLGDVASAIWVPKSLKVCAGEPNAT